MSAFEAGKTYTGGRGQTKHVEVVKRMVKTVQVRLTGMAGGIRTLRIRKLSDEDEYVIWHVGGNYGYDVIINSADVWDGDVNGQRAD